MNELNFISAFVVGLLGGVHCAGMCGGIVGAMSVGMPAQVANPKPWQLQLSYNVGRILTYTFLGALFGVLGVYIATAVSLQFAQILLLAVAAVFMILMGLYLAQWLSVLRYVESAGGLVWRLFEPLGRRFLPPKSSTQEVALGLVWGWLPCGLVYSVLTWSMSSGSAANGALLMLAFGLGTLPNLLLMGAAAQSFKQWLHRVWVKRTAGLLITIYGFYLLFAVYNRYQLLGQ